MTALVIILRIIHIFGGVAWAGASFFVGGVIAPMAQDDASVRTFMQKLNTRSKFHPYMALMATLTLLSGLVLYWMLSGFRVDFITSGRGLMLTIGSLAGLVAWMMGFINQQPTGRRMKVLVNQIESAGGPPQPEQIEQMKSLAEKLSKDGIISTILISIALIGMSVSQYVAI
jgi:uncharacterized membrane protein